MGQGRRHQVSDDWNRPEWPAGPSAHAAIQAQSAGCNGDHSVSAIVENEIVVPVRIRIRACLKVRRQARSRKPALVVAMRSTPAAEAVFVESDGWHR